MQGDVSVPGAVLEGAVFRWPRIRGRGRELEQHGGAPFLDGPVGSLEVGFAGDAAGGAEVLGREEEAVRELVFVWEDVRGEGEVGVEGASGGGGALAGGGEGEAEGRV